MSALNDKDFIINVGPNSTFHKSGHYQTLPEDIDQMFANFRQQPPAKIAIYFHGGLVNETRGLATARKIAPQLEAANCAPVCFVWETGLVEIVATNLEKISQTKLYNKLIKFLLKKVTNKLGFDSPVSRGIPSHELSDAEIEFELTQPKPFASYVGANKNGSRNATQIDSLMADLDLTEAELKKELSNDIDNDIEFQTAILQTKLTVDSKGDYTGSRGILSFVNFITHAVKIAIRVIKRFAAKRDHDLFPTIVEEILREFYLAEIGAWVWDSMKIKSDDMWGSNAGRTGLNQYVGRYFLDQLAQFKKDFPDTKINLIGHSAGSIAICNLMKYLDVPEYRFSAEHVIFMAPACRVDLFKDELLPRAALYRDLRIFTMSDAYECDDMMVPYFYTHSLLYFISGLLEDKGLSYDAHILGLERHISFKHPYDTDDLENAHTYLYENGLNRLSLGITNDDIGPGLGTGAEAHGKFDDDPKTIASIQYILNQ